MHDLVSLYCRWTIKSREMALSRFISKLMVKKGLWNSTIKTLTAIAVRNCSGVCFFRLKSSKDKKAFLVGVFFYLLLGRPFVFFICSGFSVMGDFVCLHNMNFGGFFPMPIIYSYYMQHPTVWATKLVGKIHVGKLYVVAIDGFFLVLII